jgi:hypothetical protein
MTELRGTKPRTFEKVRGYQKLLTFDFVSKWFVAVDMDSYFYESLRIYQPFQANFFLAVNLSCDTSQSSAKLHF